MGCGVRPPQGLGIKAVVYEFLVLRIGESLFLQGVDNTYSTIIPKLISQWISSLFILQVEIYFFLFLLTMKFAYRQVFIS